MVSMEINVNASNQRAKKIRNQKFAVEEELVNVTNVVVLIKVMVER